ncbi:response regulator transcription factor [Sulfitobacter sp. S0837]|uniref:helix-turn-helix transcriptional regulator n=1 Tax=Sulfitobacter maritimus TaxID=2741719 RepID=UPI0015839052|nr:response regulator transcription factor [Sulfitobacter maritimus]NUH65557.1 response regulator transcription factor [Sulfitobacter maritimus]
MLLFYRFRRNQEIRTMKPTVVVIDRRCIFSECLCEFLTSSLPEVRVLSVNNASQAAEIAFLPVTCALVSEASDIPAMRQTFPNAAFLLLCDGRGDQTPDPKMPKIMLDMPRPVFAEMVRSAARQGCVNALDPVLSATDHAVALNAVEDAGEPAKTAACAAGLSDRETEVLAALKRGLSNKVIAYEMELSENTIKIHVRNVMRKLGVTNRTMAALYETMDITEAMTSEPRH